MLNYKQLYYFWNVAKAGSITRAAEHLHLTPQTISGQISELAVRDTIHGRPVKNTEALANPGALDLYRDLPQLQN